MAIEKLLLTDTVTASTVFAGNDSGQDYKYQSSALVSYVSANINVTDNKETQYASPSATGFSVSINDNSNSAWLLLTPLAGYAAGTIVLPALNNCVDKQEIIVNTTQAVTTLTINANGAQVVGAPTTLAANAYFTLRFDQLFSTWYRVA